MHFCTHTLALLLVALLGVGQLAAQQTVLRRVLVLNFENSNKNANYDYLSESLADNLKTELIKTKQFTVLDERSLRQLKGEVATKNLSVEQASALALSANCEVVVVGRFMASARRIRLSAEAIDALSARAVTAEKADGEITSKIFETIDQLVLALSAGMQQKLPPLDLDSLRRDAALEAKLQSGDTPTAVEAASGQRETLAEEKFRLGTALGAALPLGYVGDYLTFAPAATLYGIYRMRYVSPYATLGGMLYGGKSNTIKPGLMLTGALGLAKPFALLKGERLLLTPVVAFGMAHAAFRSDYAAATLFAPQAQGGVLLSGALFARWQWALAVQLSYVLDKPQALLFTHISLGVEYKL
jgi:TolB-like protein